MGELVCTTNNLRDIVDWLKKGYIICIYADKKSIVYYSNEPIDKSINKKMIYIDVSKNPGLLDDDEWPYYIEKEGFIRYKNIESLYVNSKQIS